ncbi:MAG TPA: Rho termination factor N-terminal domain-containing protein [Kineosporiaceae bacterium]
MSNQEPGNQTSGTPELSESELRRLTVDELRRRARAEGISATSGMRKDELVSALSGAHRKDPGGGHGQRGRRGGEAGQGGGGGGRGDGGQVRRGPQSSTSVKYSQEVTSPDDEPERPGRSLVTVSHEVIRQWAQARGGRPATVEGTEHEGRAGVLRFDFGEPSDQLREISWEEWFETFDTRGLNFIYQEQRSDGRQSNFFRLENPTREDA